MANIFIEPSQKRWVDPYDEIIPTNDINEQFSALVNFNKGILNGFNVQTSNSQTIIISPGTCIIDKTMMDVSSESIAIQSTDCVNGENNVIYLEFVYELQYPLNQASYHIKKSSDVVPNDTILIIAFIDVDSSGNITNIDMNSSTDPSVTYTTDRIPDGDVIHHFIHEIIADVYNYPMIGDSDLDMGNYKIVQLADPVDNLDLVNKEYIDSLVVGRHLEDKMVMTDEYEKFPSDFVNGTGYYLRDQLKGENDYGKTDGLIVDIDNSAGSKRVKLSKIDRRCRVTSGDSGESII